ncbi:unnamed protein product [Brassica oleracea]
MSHNDGYCSYAGLLFRFGENFLKKKQNVSRHKRRCVYLKSKRK